MLAATRRAADTGRHAVHTFIANGIQKLRKHVASFETFSWPPPLIARYGPPRANTRYDRRLGTTASLDWKIELQLNAYNFGAQLAAAFLILFTASASAQQQADTGTAPFLYVVVADDARITKKGDNYVLEIDNEEIEHVLEISENPFELKNYISANDIVRNWKQGAGDFGGATMKAIILSEDGAIPDINITSIVKTANKMEYVFFLDGNAPVNLTKFRKLDEATFVNYCCHPEDGSGEWLWGGK